MEINRDQELVLLARTYLIAETNIIAPKTPYPGLEDANFKVEDTVLKWTSTIFWLAEPSNK